MNYYERHLGDYAKATSHLSLLEHGAYTMLLDRYYTNESPIPADKTYRWCMARSREEKAAVDVVLSEFFVRKGDEWYNQRADSDIARFLAQAPDKAEKKANARARQQRARERRAELFAQLRSHGIVMDYRSTTEELVTELSRVTVTVVTATQTPDTRHQSPVPIKSFTEASTHVTQRERDQGSMSDATFACLLMKHAGCHRVNPSNIDLIAAIDEGVTPQALADTAAEGLSLGKSEPFAWAIATARGRHAEGPKPVTASTNGRVGPTATGPTSKTGAAVMKLQGIINGNQLDSDRNREGLAGPVVLELGSATRARAD